MGTAQKLGIDQWRFEAMPEADAVNYVGKPNSLTIAVNTDNVPQRLHLHDGATPGGFVISLVPSGTIMSMLPPKPLAPIINAMGLTAGTPFNVNHQLGFYPSVAVLDDQGNVVAADVQHFDAENLAVTVPTNGDYRIIL